MHIIYSGNYHKKENAFIQTVEDLERNNGVVELFKLEPITLKEMVYRLQMSMILGNKEPEELTVDYGKSYNNKALNTSY